VIAVEGDIELGDCERWEAALKPTVTNVVLNSRGGRVGQGQCISRSIAARRLATHVRESCASVCFLLFAAGTQKWACADARIGVHSSRDVKSGREGDNSSLIEYANRYRVPAAIQKKLSETSSHDMYWLNALDLTSMSVKRCAGVAGNAKPSAAGRSPVSNGPQATVIDDCREARGRAALKSCTTVIDDASQISANRAYAYVLRARAGLDVSELEPAEADLRAALALSQGLPFAYRVRGRLRGLQGRNAEARADYTRAIELSETQPARYVAYTDRGSFFSHIGEVAKALDDFNAAVRLDPSRASAYVGRALTYKALNKTLDALANLDWAAAVEPGFSLTYVERGDILVMERRYNEAVAAYELALGKNATDGRALRGREAALAKASNRS
jgi:tetratricopeptide (TPR) repeat protein